MAKPNRKDPEELFRKGLALYKSGGYEDAQEGIHLIYEAAKLGHPEAKDWIEDFGFDDDAGVQGAS